MLPLAYPPFLTLGVSPAIVSVENGVKKVSECDGCQYDSCHLGATCSKV